MNNREVADTFEKVSQMLSIRGDSVHRVLAYQKAAESLRNLSRDLRQIRAEAELTDIHGIGDTLAAKIEEMLDTGELAFYERLAQEIPPGLVDLLRVEGLGPKRAKQIYATLGITTLEELTATAAAGNLRQLPGIGAKTEQKILDGIAALARHGDDRTSVGEAWPVAQELLVALEKLPGVRKTAVAGSLRRMQETIGDIDLLVAAADSEPIMDAFSNLPQVESVSLRGPSKTSVILVNGLQVDLRVLPSERWGTLLSYFTGSKAHNVRLRELARQKGLSLNEHAFTPQNGGEEILCAREEEVYQILDLPYIPPALRQDQGEIEAAQAGELPSFVQLDQIVSDLHLHTTWSDGKMSILEMAQAAQAEGLQGVAITDHSVSLGIANGLSVERLHQQAEAIALARQEMGPDFFILHGTEMEIRADGSLDYPDEVLTDLDLVIASLHISLSQPREQITERLLGAIYNPHVDMIGHPTGRLLPERPGADLDMESVFAAAVETGTILEINANPQRLDLRDVHVRRALERGVKLAVNTDAHHVDQFRLRHYGVATARRGWAMAASVVNTWPIPDLLTYLGRETL